MFFFCFYGIVPFFEYEKGSEDLWPGAKLVEKLFDFNDLDVEYYNLVLEYIVILIYVLIMT